MPPESYDPREQTKFAARFHKYEIGCTSASLWMTDSRAHYSSASRARDVESVAFKRDSRLINVEASKFKDQILGHKLQLETNPSTADGVAPVGGWKLKLNVNPLTTNH